MKDKLQAGIEHHRAGDLAEAANLYRSVLNAVPNDPDALHLLALVLAVEGQEQQAIAMIEKAIEHVLGRRPITIILRESIDEADRWGLQHNIFTMRSH